MGHTATNKDQLLARVRRIAGQVAAIERAIADEAAHHLPVFLYIKSRELH